MIADSVSAKEGGGGGPKGDDSRTTAQSSATASEDERERQSRDPSASNSDDPESGKRKRLTLANLRTTTMFEPRDAAHQNRNKAVRDWTVPKVRGGRAPRAATLFLGKDVERWQQHERERLDASGSAGLRVAWRAGASSTIQVSSAGVGTPLHDDDDEEEGSDSSYSSDRDSDTIFSFGDNSDAKTTMSASQSASRRSSTHRRSSSRGSKSQSKSFPRVIQTHGEQEPKRRGSIGQTGSSPTGSAFSNEGSVPGSLGSRPRRFSSNGPEAAFLRHETVIGIHTPHRRESNASISSSFERIALAPLSQIKSASGRKSSVVSPPGSGDRSPGGGPSPVRTKAIKSISSSEFLAQAAEAAAAAVSRHRQKESSLPIADTAGDTADDEEHKPKEKVGQGKGRRLPSPGHGRRYSSSPARALKLAPRRRPVRIDGTLYDRSGPYREGAVTDGLCVRFFSTEDVSEKPNSKPHTSRSSKDQNGKHASAEVAVADEELVPATYLITTPDNRVSSAAKLRRWAMDGEGKFYAAMEIKSIEAKMRAADPSMAGPGGGVPKSLLRELRGRYIEDLLDEVQKAETLNPGRAAVAHVLCTSDNKFLRLEEDYPEEAFFVIAGCDEHELHSVISLVFAAAVRAIADFHSAGWLHGDIKLENLMFDERGKLVVIDYENANPFRGIRGGDGRVTLVSYDWVPPEAFPGPHGRRAGPSADLWALGCNMVRAFALRDNVEDGEIREALLGRGQEALLDFRRTKLLRRRSDASGNPVRRGSDVGIPGSSTRPLPTADDVDLSCLLQGDGGGIEDEEADQAATDGWHPQQHLPPALGPSPQRLLGRFAREAPDLLKLVIARCISDLPEERSVEAELDCLRFADSLDQEQKEKGDESRLGIGQRAVKTAIELSGSSWVRPKLHEARRNLRLGGEEGEQGERPANGGG